MQSMFESKCIFYLFKNKLYMKKNISFYQSLISLKGSNYMYVIAKVLFIFLKKILIIKD